MRKLLSMLFSIVKKLIGKNAPNDVPHRIYGTVVTQSRNSHFFTQLGIADTVMGRYDMLSLHVFLVNRRLKYVEPDEKTQAMKLSQEIFDLFIVDMERGLRELGFADTSVHKRKKRLARSYYALIEEFDEALETAVPGALIEVIAKRYFETAGETEKAGCAPLLETYMYRAVKFLADRSINELSKGVINWPLIVGEPVES